MAIIRAQEQQLKTTTSVVNHLVANQGVLFVKLHQYHWYVQGPDFFRLHEQFEAMYNETSASFDLFAERLIAKGEKPFSTLNEFLNNASISEKAYDKKIQAEDMVSHLVEDYQAMRSITLKGVELAAKEDDAVTEDMLIEYKEGLDKTIWMLQAYLGKDAR